MDVSRHMGYQDQAELYLRLIREEIDAWRELDAFPGAGDPDAMDVLALLVSPRLEGLLKQAGKDSGEPYWDRLQNLDVPVPILVSDSIGDSLWSALYRADAEKVFTALSENGWAPSGWGEAVRN